MYHIFFSRSLFFNSVAFLSLLSRLDFCNDFHCVRDRESVISDETCDSFSHVTDFTQLDEHWNIFVKRSVVRIIVPRDDWQATFRLQCIRRWRVVNDDSILHWSAQLGHILHENTIDESAVLAKQTTRCPPMRIHHIHQWISILDTHTQTRYIRECKADLPWRAKPCR